MHRYFLFCFFSVISLICNGKIVLPEILSDNMVLQQATDVKLWGTASKNSKIVIRPSWSEFSYVTKSDDLGTWCTTIKTPKASYITYEISITDGDEVLLKNVLIGEVWFCSGQSNMEMPLNGFGNCPVEGANELIATSLQMKWIRMATIPQNGQLRPVPSCAGSWKISCPKNTGHFSAVGTHFAILLNKALDVPVGIINCSWGGSKLEGWLSNEIVSDYPDIDIDKDIKKINGTGRWHYHCPTIMYNGMIKPLVNYTIKGFLWYQGESNVGKHNTYAERQKTMVELWRKDWGLGQLPFYYVELSPYGSSESYITALFREAQYKAQFIIPNSGMISTNDLVPEYDRYNTHPRNKAEVGKRLAYMALNKTYKEYGVSSIGPSYKSMEIKNDSIIIFLNNISGGFSNMGNFKGFEIAGEDKVFYPAKADIYNDRQISVTSDKVKNPVAVRYCFRDYLPGSVANIKGLPLYPFRTDSW